MRKITPDRGPLQCHWLGDPLRWVIVDTEARQILTCQHTLEWAEAWQIMESERREGIHA